ncbi:hypothetical protein EDB92DRAFT_2020747 [Lactarius akahatsu]|uniref:Uncharacterized protein n=1 Tax=Lactarius akahatsu TaxID=416441 RepID=A0AAD4LAH6_9AGAM|nr:hypothetical protein EDB92DRAFT_2020747 [Lactarius akahatsu]
MSDTELPPYSGVHEPSPLYSPSQPLASSSSGSRDKPLTFHVGLHELQDSPVKIKHLKLHLCFLGALHDLRKKVQSKTYATWPPLIRKLDGEQRWSWFVNLAVERFQRWVEHLSPPSGPNTFAEFVCSDMPPLDVWMVLHAYLLNPQSFAEDCIRIGSLKPLAILTVSTPDFFLDALDTIHDMVKWNPNSSSRRNWVTKTGLSFDPFDCAAVLSDQEVLCPKCKAAVNVPYVTTEEMGYAQQKFSRACPFCTFEITRETLAVAKLTTDLTAHLLHRPQTGSTNMQLFLPGTLRNELGEDTAQAVDITQNLLNLKPIDQFNSHKWQENQGTSLAMAESLGWKLVSEIKKSLSKFEQWKMFCAKVPLSKNIYDLGWTSSSYFEKHEDAAVLHHAIVRYHAFLDLMTSSQMLVVPTLDIDLVWHSHQLSGPRYHKDCRTNVGRYVDQCVRRNVSGLKGQGDHSSASSRVSFTCCQKRYGIPYTQCGCPLTIGQKLARLVPLLGSKLSGSKHPLARLAPPADRSEILAASRPSDHDTVAVLGLPYNFAAKAQRDGKALRRREYGVSTMPIGVNMISGNFAGCGGCGGGGCASGGCGGGGGGGGC